MKKRRKVTININLSNRWLYTLIAIGIVLVVCVGVYAVGIIPNPGHQINQLQTCDNNQILETVNGVWTCVALPSAPSGTISGLEMVTKICPSSSSCNVPCSSGKKILSGSGYCTGAIVGIQTNLNVNTVYVTCSSSGYSYAYAICAAIS